MSVKRSKLGTVAGAFLFVGYAAMPSFAQDNSVQSGDAAISESSKKSTKKAPKRSSQNSVPSNTVLQQPIKPKELSPPVEALVIVN